MRLLLLLGALVACTPAIPEPIWEGEFLHYSTTIDAPVCRGSFVLQERHAVEVAALMGFELPEVIHFTRIKQRQVRKYCRQRARGCAWDDAPYAFFAESSFNFHELTHVVANLGGLSGPRAFNEGLAEVFADTSASILSGTPLARVLHGDIDDIADYHTAGRFVRFLIERHDLSVFVEFMRSTWREAEFDEFAPIFAEVFGEPIEDAMADFADYPSCSSTSNRIAVLDCNLPLQPWDGATLSLTANLACDQADVLGPDRHGLMFTSRGFEIAQEGTYRITPSASSEWALFRIIRCGSCWDDLEIGIMPGTTEELVLPPGRYYAQFGRRTREPAELGLQIEQR
ncbi:hypothetical protein [Nannocystis bainbridge]|uniref:Uncharacterized protein n=1 Tax=Nannocystis bainbridge TaxID=2995303 RepID=A0ABT5DRW3_9BACT|nr:hypothetical protein [Nannocystis bainbridge]MDC0716396.1 hypothetical protein [Nannocystis bainbridge]